MNPSTDIPRIVIFDKFDGGYGVRTIIQSLHHKTVYEAMADGEIGPFECQQVAEHFAGELTAAKKMPFQGGVSAPVVEAIRRAVNARNARSMSQAFPQDFNLAMHREVSQVSRFDEMASMALIAISFVLMWGGVWLKVAS
jgi:hypothetical protein